MFSFQRKISLGRKARDNLGSSSEVSFVIALRFHQRTVFARLSGIFYIIRLLRAAARSGARSGAQ